MKINNKTSLKNKKEKELIKNDNNNQTLLSKKAKTWIVVGVILFSLLFAISVGFNIYGAMVINDLTKSQVQSLLSDCGINLKENQTQCVGISLLNNTIGGVEYPQQIKLKSGELENSVVVRIKAILINSDGKEYNVELKNSNEYVLGDDNYYYLNNVVNNQTENLLINGFILPNSFSVNNKISNSHIIVVYAETLSYDSGYANKIWENAPSEWLINYGSGGVLAV